MSHLATVQTEIRDLELAQLAAQALGVSTTACAVPVQLKSYYGEPSEGCQLVFGTNRALGLALQETGAYAVTGDVFCDQETALVMGGRPYQNSWYGTSPPGPTLFLREYAVQTALRIAQENGMAVERLPATGDDDLPEGRTGEKIILSGGYLPPHMRMIVVAVDDGTCRVAFDGATDSSCYLYTRPLEDALGALLTDVSNLQTCHQTVAGVTCHVKR